MFNHPKLTVFTFTLFLFILLPTAVTADSIAPPHSYTKPTPDGRYLFVMHSPLTLEEELALNPPNPARIEEIRTTYPHSGLYPNDGTTTPLWTVDWYAYNVEPLSDGVHLVRPGPWATSYNDDAVAFYENGRLIRSYVVRELVALPFLLPESVSHFSWRESGTLQDAEKTYTVTTLHREQYTFDVTTGRILDSFSPISWIASIAFVAVVGTLIGLFEWWRHRRNPYG